MMKRTPWWKQWGNVVGLTGDRMVWHLCGIPFKYFVPGTHIQYSGWQLHRGTKINTIRTNPDSFLELFMKISTHKIACYAVNFLLLHTLIEYKDVVSGVWRDIAVKLMFVSHLALQVHLGPTGEEQLYNVSMTLVTGTHEGSPAVLRNTMRQNSTVTVMNMKRQLKGVYLLLSTNYMRQSITLIWTSCIHISHSLVQQSFQY